MKKSIPIQIQTIIESAVIAVFPTALTEIIGNALDIKLLNDYKTTTIILSYLITAVVSFLLMNYFDSQQLRKYEGKWVEIIPDSDRKISVCDFYKEDLVYHFDGRNYKRDSIETRDFSSRKLVGHGEKGFFYITKCAEAINSPEGYGKVFSVSNREEGFYKGKGYFFDVNEKDAPKIMKTYMFKFEPKFYNNHIKIHPNDNPKDFSDERIINAVRDYVKEAYNVDI